MKQPSVFIGIDASADQFVATIFRQPTKTPTVSEPLQNSLEGCTALMSWLKLHRIQPEATMVCLEATGVYGEQVCYFLHSHGFQVALEPPLKVKRAFEQSGHKNDRIDSQQIAEYAYRFADELTLWKPSNQILEQIRVLLTAREQFSTQLVANMTALKTVQRKYVQTPLANERYQRTIDQLCDNIKAIDQEIKHLMDQDSSFRQLLHLLTSIPGVGLLLASNLLVTTAGFTKPVSARQLAAHAGICPYEHTSGKSVHRRPRSRRYGPARLRKLLYLAALTVRTHNLQFQRYFLRKVAEGKSKRLVLNNIANKLLKIICAVIKTQTPFIPNYQSVNPMLLKTS